MEFLQVLNDEVAKVAVVEGAVADVFDFGFRGGGD